MATLEMHDMKPIPSFKPKWGSEAIHQSSTGARFWPVSFWFPLGAAAPAPARVQFQTPEQDQVGKGVKSVINVHHC